MKRTALALTLILALFSAVVSTQMVNLAEANPNLIKGFYCNISVQSPQNGTYSTAPVLLNFTVKNNYVYDVYLYFYLLDEQDMQSSVEIEEIEIIGEETISNDTHFPYTEYTLKGQAVLSNLSDGPHNVTVFMGWVNADGVIYPANIDPFSATAIFNVDSTIKSPSPSPQETQTAPFPTTFVAASAAIVATGSGLSAAYYVRKKKNNKHQTPP